MNTLQEKFLEAGRLYEARLFKEQNQSVKNFTHIGKIKAYFSDDFLVDEGPQRYDFTKSILYFSFEHMGIEVSINGNYRVESCKFKHIDFHKFIDRILAMLKDKENEVMNEGFDCYVDEKDNAKSIVDEIIKGGEDLMAPMPQPSVDAHKLKADMLEGMINKLLDKSSISFNNIKS